MLLDSVKVARDRHIAAAPNPITEVLKAESLLAGRYNETSSGVWHYDIHAFTPLEGTNTLQLRETRDLLAT